MKGAFNAVIGLIALIVAVWAGFTAWRFFDVIHFFVVDAVGDDLERRGDGSQVHWRDYLEYGVFYLPVLILAVLAYLSGGFGIWRLTRVFQRAEQ